MDIESKAGSTGVNRRAFALGGLAAAAGVGLTAAPAAAATTSVPNLYPNWNRNQFQAIQDHESSHVSFLVQALGASARPKPTFKNLLQPNIRAFATVSQALENTGVGAYRGAAPIIFSRQYLDAAASIALIEARHAGYLNVLFNGLTTDGLTESDQTFEAPLTIKQVVDAATPFIASLNGGPALTFSSTPSRNNDIAILNFALALEYLESEFYNLNVPKFFP